MKSSLPGLAGLLLLTACVAVQPQPSPTAQDAAASADSGDRATPASPQPGGRPQSAPEQPAQPGAHAIEASSLRDAGDSPERPAQIAAVVQEIQAAVPKPNPARTAYPTAPEQLSLWTDPAERARFEASYRAESEVTPPITDAERATLMKVRDLLADDQSASALELLKKEQRDDSTAIFDYFRANIHAQSGNVDEAIAAYRIAVTRFPRYRQAWNLLGKLTVRQGHYPDALEAFTQVVELGGGSGEMYGLLGYAHAKQGQPVQAETAYRMAVMLEPSNADWQIGLARSLFDQRQFAAAISMCESLIQKSPERHELWLMQGEAFARSNQPIEAAKNFEMVDRLGHANAASLLSVGDIYARERLFGMAARSYMRALAHDPIASEARALRGAQYLLGQDASEWAAEVVHAMEAYAEERFSMQTRKEMLRIQAVVAVQSGDAEAELAILEKSLELDPSDGRTLIQVGEYKQRQGDLENAIFYFERASKIEGFEGDALIAHGQALVRAGRYQEAVPLLKQGQKIQPSDRLQSYLETVERLARRG